MSENEPQKDNENKGDENAPLGCTKKCPECQKVCVASGTKHSTHTCGSNHIWQ